MSHVRKTNRKQTAPRSKFDPNSSIPASVKYSVSIKDMVFDHGSEIARRLGQLRVERGIAPTSKPLRWFSLSEAASFLGISPSNLKKLYLDGKGPLPTVQPNGRRSYSARTISDLRIYLDKNGRTGSKRYMPRRRQDEPLQVISIVNFREGSGKTTMAAHLSQYLALNGHRVLALDMDPQATLSALFGFEPDLAEGGTIYDAIRDGNRRRPLSELVKPTNIPSLDIVPASIDLQEFEISADECGTLDNHAVGLRWQGLTKSLESVDCDYDIVVIDTPPQLGHLTLTAFSAATGVLVAVHPHLSDLTTMSRFLLMLSEQLKCRTCPNVQSGPDWLKYIVTRFDQTDIPQAQNIGLMQSILAGQMIKQEMLLSSSISEAMESGRTIYEVERSGSDRAEHDRAMKSLESVNCEIRDIIHAQWGRIPV